MVEKLKDAEDRILESLFAHSALADNGFSHQVVGKLRRRMWLRRLTIPLAAIIGFAIAFQPLTALVGIMTRVSSLVPTGFYKAATETLPQIPVIALGAMLLATCLIGLRFLDE